MKNKPELKCKQCGCEADMLYFQKCSTCYRKEMNSPINELKRSINYAIADIQNTVGQCKDIKKLEEIAKVLNSL